MKRMLLAGALLLLFPGTRAQAQDVYIGGGGEAIIPVTSDITDIAKAGWGAGAKIDLYFTENVAARLDGYYEQFGKEEVSPGVESDLQVNAFRVGILYRFMSSKVQPYVTGMGGAYVRKVDLTSGASLETTRTKFGLAGGGGVLVPLGNGSPAIDLNATFDAFFDNNSSTLGYVRVGAAILFRVN